MLSDYSTKYWLDPPQIVKSMNNSQPLFYPYMKQDLMFLTAKFFNFEFQFCRRWSDVNNRNFLRECYVAFLKLCALKYFKYFGTTLHKIISFACLRNKWTILVMVKTLVFIKCVRATYLGIVQNSRKRFQTNRINWELNGIYFEGKRDALSFTMECQRGDSKF